MTTQAITITCDLKREFPCANIQACRQLQLFRPQISGIEWELWPVDSAFVSV